MTRLLSVNVGLPREVTWRGKTVYTSVSALLTGVFGLTGCNQQELDTCEAASAVVGSTRHRSPRRRFFEWFPSARLLLFPIVDVWLGRDLHWRDRHPRVRKPTQATANHRA